MPPEIHLLLHNFSFIISAIVTLLLAILVYIKDHKPFPNKMLIAAFITTILFVVSHLLAVNVSDPALSRFILNLTISNIFIGLFLTYSTFSYMNILEQQKKVLAAITALSIALWVFFWSFPDAFLLESVPKMYFPNYYEAGSMYWLLIVWYMLTGLYFFYQIFKTYPHLDPQLKNRAKYFITGYLIGFVFGSLAYFLVLDTPVHPLWISVLAPVFAIPFSYAVLKDEPLDIRIAAKRTLIYVVIVSVVGIFIVLFNYLNNLIIVSIPSVPMWFLPFISALIAVSVGVFVWNKFRQGELLKYEFITVVTHKFRTPLTHIKWAAENLVQPGMNEDDKVELAHIQNANTKLVELTNLLMNVSETENTAFDYQIRKNDLAADVSDVLIALKSSADAKQVTLVNNVGPGAFGIYDTSRVKFVIQVLVENAILYTPAGGSVTISTTETNDEISLRITDTGIGISTDELSHLFSKFYRASSAKITDTDGMGIGLFLSRSVIERQSGKIWAESDGPGKGSTFAFSLPRK